MEFRILGPLEVVDGDRLLVLGGPKQRTLLAALLVHANKVVSAESLIDALWPERPPRTAHAALQVHVSQLRKALGQDRIVTRGPGYLIRAEENELDAKRFEQLVTHEGGATEQTEEAGLTEALALWRGPPLGEFEQQPFARAPISRLVELRLAAEERRIEAEFAVGHHSELLPQLEEMVANHPYRERLRGQLMIALYRSDRQADALAAYRTARATLAEELGIEPGPALRRLERAILDQDPILEASASAAAAATTGRQEQRFPARSTSFVGRTQQVSEIRARLRRPEVRLLTLTGAPGTGKTRLAIESAAGLDADFPNGIVLVELAPIADPQLVPATIADALSLKPESGAARLADSIATHLNGRRVLLVLDNFEQVLGAAPLIERIVTGTSHLTFLVTSRAPLDVPSERIYRVPALQLPERSRAIQLTELGETESIRLFVERARDAREDFELSEANAGALTELCIRLDGLPLPLELAAARVRLLSPREILDRLDRKVERLKAEPGVDLPERHRTLRAAIAWSYDLLGANERALFANLGVFVGGFTLEGAKAVAGDLDLDLVDGVESLLGHSLLRTEAMAAEEPRLGMLETIREYALERLAEHADGEGGRRRHAGFYLLLAEEAEGALLGPAQRSWLRRLDAERDNIRAALSWAAESGDPDVGLRIGAALCRYWQLRGSDTEGRQHLERLLARSGGSREARAVAQARIASLALFQGDNEAVRRFGEESLPVLRRAGEDVKIAGTLGVMAVSSLALGEPDHARALAEEALEIALGTGDLVAKTMAGFSVGVVLASRGEFDEAERLIEKSVGGARQLGNVRSVANFLRVLGGIAVARGDSARARDLFEESLALHRTLDDTWGTSHALSRLGLVLLQLHEHEAARRLVAESIAIEQKSGDRPGLIFNFEVLAGLAAAENRGTRAARLYACAAELRESAGTHPAEVGWPDPAERVARLQTKLGEERFSEAWAQGRAMTLNESLPYALETND